MTYTNPAIVCTPTTKTDTMPTMETTPQFTNPACRVAPPGTFHPDRLEIGYAKYREAADEALTICNTCEHRRDCLIYALRTDERDGVWGHTTETDRTHIFWAHTSNHQNAKWVKTTEEMVELVNSLGIDPATADKLGRFIRAQRTKIRALATAIEHALPEAAHRTPAPQPVSDDQSLAADMIAVLRVLAERDAATWELRTETGNKKAAVLVAKACKEGWIEPNGQLSKNETRQLAPVYRLTDTGYERIPDE